MVLCKLSPLLLIMVSVLWKLILIPLLFSWNLNLGIYLFEVSILDLLMSFMDSAPMPLEGSVAPSSPGSSQMADQVDPCSTSVVPADEESKGSDSSSSSEDSLKVHDGSADGRADASPGTPATRIESPAASDSDSPRYQKLDIVERGELDFWNGQIREAFQDALEEIDPCGRYGKIPTEHLLDALRLKRGDPITVGEMEEICKALRGSWPSREDADRTSIHHRLWELLERHERPEE